MSFWLFLRIMMGLLAGKIFFGQFLSDDVEYEWLEYLALLVFRIFFAFICWWGLTPLLNLL